MAFGNARVAGCNGAACRAGTRCYNNREGHQEVPALGLTWLLGSDFAHHLRVSGRRALASSIQPAAEVAAAVGMLSSPGSEAEERRRLLALLTHAADSGFQRLSGRISARLRVSVASWVDVFYSLQYFEALRIGCKRAELRVNAEPYAAVRSGFWIRCRPDVRSHCLWLVVSTVLRYRSFSEAYFSGAFDPRLLGNQVLNRAERLPRNPTPLEVERHFYMLNRRKERGNDQRKHVATRWSSMLGTKDRVLVWLLEEPPPNVQPPGARFQVRATEDLPRFLDVRPAWRRLSRVLARVRFFNRLRRLCSRLDVARFWRRALLRLRFKLCVEPARAFLAQPVKTRNSDLRSLATALRQHRQALVKSSVVAQGGKHLAVKCTASVLFCQLQDGVPWVWCHVRPDGYPQPPQLSGCGSSTAMLDTWVRETSFRYGIPRSWMAALQLVLSPARSADSVLEVALLDRVQLLSVHSWVVPLEGDALQDRPLYRQLSRLKVCASSMRWRRLDELREGCSGPGNRPRYWLSVVQQYWSAAAEGIYHRLGCAEMARSVPAVADRDHSWMREDADYGVVEERNDEAVAAFEGLTPDSALPTVAEGPEGDEVGASSVEEQEVEDPNAATTSSDVRSENSTVQALL